MHLLHFVFHSSSTYNYSNHSNTTPFTGTPHRWGRRATAQRRSTEGAEPARSGGVTDLRSVWICTAFYSLEPRKKPSWNYTPWNLTAWTWNLERIHWILVGKWRDPYFMAYEIIPIQVARISSPLKTLKQQRFSLLTLEDGIPGLLSG